jgi:Ser/Thr protein kinase RdoA (MazF antagonist)
VNQPARCLAYAHLTPDTVLDALDSVGLRTDGRLLALNSFENRVYQVGQEEGAPVVAKFYRPDRWSDAAILEEHAFTLELAAREIPVVPPLILADGASLQTHHSGFRFAVYPRRGGRMPEFDRSDTLEWMGRFIGRIHAIGGLKPYQASPHPGHRQLRRGTREFLLSRTLAAGRPAAGLEQRDRSGAGSRARPVF